MALSDILKKILDDALAAVREIEKKCKEDSKKLEVQHTQDLEKKKNEITGNVEKKKGDIDKRMKTLVKMEERNQVLKIKQRIINEVFEKAIDKLNNLPDAQYEDLVVKLLKSLPALDQGQIVPAKGKQSITEKAIKKGDIKYKLGEEGAFSGGFIFKSDYIEVNSTFKELVLQELKPKMEPDVADILFQKTFKNMFS